MSDVDIAVLEGLRTLAWFAITIICALCGILIVDAVQMFKRRGKR